MAWVQPQRVAGRLSVPSRGAGEVGDTIEAAVSIVETIEFFAGGHLLNAVDLLVYALPRRRWSGGRQRGRLSSIETRRSMRSWHSRHTSRWPKHCFGAFIGPGGSGPRAGKGYGQGDDSDRRGMLRVTCDDLMADDEY